MTDARSTAEEQAAAWWAALDPVQVYLEQIARFSELEVKMLARHRP